MSDRNQRQAEFLIDLMQIISTTHQNAGLTQEEAEELGLKACEELVKRYSGLQFYFQKGKSLFSMFRHAEIFNKFNGRNVPDLAKEYDVSEVWIYKIIRQEHDKRQGKLFGDLEE